MVAPYIKRRRRAAEAAEKAVKKAAPAPVVEDAKPEPAPVLEVAVEEPVEAPAASEEVSESVVEEPVVAEEPEVAPEPEPEVDLSSMLKRELVVIAEERGHDVSGMTKSQILELLQ